MTVYVSQDGHDVAVGDLVQQYGQGLLAPPHTSFFDHWQRDRVPQLGSNQASQSKLAPYFSLLALPCSDALSAHTTLLCQCKHSPCEQPVVTGFHSGMMSACSGLHTDSQTVLQ